jgi:hypothetical protein
MQERSPSAVLLHRAGVVGGLESLLVLRPDRNLRRDDGEFPLRRVWSLIQRAKLAQIVAIPASASPPAVTFRLRELGLVDF